MAKVGRASRNASLLRVESVSGTKAIAAAESGEVYIITAASTVTLPAAKAGAYFKFIIGADITSATALVINAVANQDMAGCVARYVEAATGVDALTHAAVAQAAIADGHDKLTIDSSSHPLHPGSCVECVSDGTNWFVNGNLWANNVSVTATFGTQ